jgi:hypothetical protein
LRTHDWALSYVESTCDGRVDLAITDTNTLSGFLHGVDSLSLAGRADGRLVGTTAGALPLAIRMTPGPLSAPERSVFVAGEHTGASYSLSSADSRRVAQGLIGSSAPSFAIRMDAQAAGVYVLRVEAGGSRATARFVYVP